MPRSYLLDTSVLIPYRAGDTAVVEQMRNAAEVYVPIVAVGELLFGALKSANPEKNRAWVEELVTRTAILDCDLDTAAFYAQTRDRLRRSGFPIPENDLWIAAVAQQHGLALAARDKHFALVSGLVVDEW